MDKHQRYLFEMGVTLFRADGEIQDKSCLGSLFSNGANSLSLLRRSLFSTHHLRCGMAFSMPAGKDNKVIINDVGG